MRLRVSPALAWVLRTFLLPFVIATKRFPRGARAPSEIRPDEAESHRMTRADATARLTRVAREAADALRDAGTRRPGVQFSHAYFGQLSALTTLRLLGAHTRHHVRRLPAAG
jgi:hypothetical protein